MAVLALFSVTCGMLLVLAALIGYILNLRYMIRCVRRGRKN